MEKEINIAEILKDCPKGTKLYTTLYGEVTLESVTDIEHPIEVMTKGGTMHFMRDGRYDEYGECILFPSKDQRNWSRFEPIVPVSYFIGDYGKIWVKKGEDTEEDIERKEFGNDFATFEQAEYAAKEVKKLLLSFRKEAE